MKHLFAIVAIVALITGCQSPQKTAYVALAAIGQAVDSSMSAAADATVAGKVSAEDWQKIAVVHSQFRAAYRTACELAAFDYTKAGTPELLALERRVLDTINEILTKPAPKKPDVSSFQNAIPYFAPGQYPNSSTLELIRPVCTGPIPEGIFPQNIGR